VFILSICLFVGDEHVLCKNSWDNRPAIWGGGSCVPKEWYIRWGPDLPMGKDKFFGEMGLHIPIQHYGNMASSQITLEFLVCLDLVFCHYQIIQSYSLGGANSTRTGYHTLGCIPSFLVHML